MRKLLWTTALALGLASSLTQAQEGDLTVVWSDDSTSESLKWRAAKVDLPEPDTPTSATTQSSGIATVTV